MEIFLAGGLERPAVGSANTTKSNSRRDTCSDYAGKHKFRGTIRVRNLLTRALPKNYYAMPSTIQGQKGREEVATTVESWVESQSRLIERRRRGPTSLTRQREVSTLRASCQELPWAILIPTLFGRATNARQLVTTGLALYSSGFKPEAHSPALLFAPMSDGVQTCPQKRRRYSGQPAPTTQISSKERKL